MTAECQNAYPCPKIKPILNCTASSLGPWLGADLSRTAQSGLGMLNMLRLLCVGATLLPCCPAEAGLRLAAGSGQLRGAGGTGRAFIHRGFRSEKNTLYIT